MKYITNLTKEEIKYICTVIPYQETAAYFKKYPKEFTKIRPGFRVKSLNEDMVTRILYEFRSKDFIFSYLNKHIEKWIKEIDEELVNAKEKGLDQEAAYVDVLSRSFFSGNVALFFKIKEQEKSDEYLSVLSCVISYENEHNKENEKEFCLIKQKIQELVAKQKNLEQQLTAEQKTTENLRIRERELNEQLEQNSCSFAEQQVKYSKSEEKCKKLRERVEELEVDLKNSKEDEDWKSSEMQQKIDALTQRVKEQSKQIDGYCATISDLDDKITSTEEEIKTWQNQVRNREKQIFTYKAEKAALLTEKDNDKKQIRELKKALEQALSVEKTYKVHLDDLQSKSASQVGEIDIKASVEEQKLLEDATKMVSKRCSENERYIPMRPENMDDFDEYFRYNLENIGFDQKEDGSIDFIYYIEKLFFQGIPLLTKRGLGINLANSLSNTLYGVPAAARLLYSYGSDTQKVKEFLEKTPDRVVCIDGYIGNCNVLEFIPVLEQYSNKIIVLTYMFDKTLTFVPNEILSYVHFISADMFEPLLKIKDVTEDPSEIKEVPETYKGAENSDSRLQKIFRDIACECGVEISTASAMASVIEDENHLNEMLMFSLLPYVQKVFGKNPYNCSKRLQRYAGESGRCTKKDIIMRWFG